MTPDQITKFASDPAAYRAALLIDAEGGPARFQPDVWQASDFAALDAGWLAAAGRSTTDSSLSRAYLERPRGHSKTMDLAVMALWCLAFARRPVSGIAAAADRDQARLLRDACQRLVVLNGWLQTVLQVQAYKIVNTRTKSALEIISSDTASSWGLTPDFIVCDEIVPWRNEELWESLLSASAKREHCVLIVISNAGCGLGESWQWRVREACRADPAWHFSRLEGPKATWIDDDRLEEQRRLLPDLAYKRLWAKCLDDRLGRRLA